MVATPTPDNSCESALSDEHQNALNDPRLVDLIEQWRSLPESTREEILRLAEANAVSRELRDSN
jgi:hypothetical protein